MAQEEASDVTTRYYAGRRGDAGGTMPVRQAYSSVAGDQYVTPSPSISSSSQSSKYMTAGMSEEQIWAAIEASREQGWSELKDSSHDGAYPASRHAEHTAVIWDELKRRHPWVFRDLTEEWLKVGQVIAEGGQAQICEATFRGYSNELVAKVFRMEGFSLADLQRQWPINTKAPIQSGRSAGHVLGGVVFSELLDCCSQILWGTFLGNGSFAFVMERYWGDLRTLLDLKMKDNNSQGSPFSYPHALNIMWDISRGMNELHRRGVLHRDLKAANILISPNPRIYEDFHCYVADFESSMLIQGIGFWRAPEVLIELQKEPFDRNANIWTEKVDVYSFAMTCYEILTGYIPFDGYVKNDWKRIIDGERCRII